MIIFDSTNEGFTLTTELALPRPLAEVFPFFANAQNLEQITPASLNFRITSPLPIEMKVGALIDYCLRLNGIPMNWQSEISAWEPPHRFVDEQRRGPYRFWIHEHSFREEGDQTIVRDYVRYAMFGGKLIHELFVKRELRKIFGYRQETLKRLFTTAEGASSSASI